ncbi:SAF domain-containing protein [Fredinandcohnia humi]
MLESKRRALIFITVSLLLATAAGFFVLKKVQEMNNELGGMTEIYVAASDIASRTLIQPDQVKKVEIPNRYVNEASHVTDVNKLINKVLIVPLEEGEIITHSMIKPVAAATNENNRLVTIPATDRINFDQLLEAQDRVDIIVSQSFEDKPLTEIFMKDVLVAGVLDKNKGIVVEVPAEVAPEIIHMQNYADSMRILKANVGKGTQPNTEEVKTEDEEKVTETKEVDAKVEQPKEAEPKTEEEQKDPS